MSIGKRVALACAGLLLPLAVVSAKDDAHKVAAGAIQRHMEDVEAGSPFRKALKEKQKERKGAGKKFPADVVLHEPRLEENADGIGWGKGDCPDKGRCPTPGYVVRYTLKTEINYSGPDELYDAAPGKPHAKWPALAIRNHVKQGDDWVPEPGSERDFTEDYKKLMADRAAAEGKVAWRDEDHPEGLYEFGEEPQTEEITEEITFTFKKGQDKQAREFFRRLLAASAAGDAPPERAILMGFTYSGPNIDYTVGSRKRACLFGGCVTVYDIRAGFALDYALGLRLPAYSSLTGPATLVAGRPAQFASVIEARDWSGDDYASVGAAAEDGHEFVLRLEMFAGAKVEILGADVCPYCQYVEIKEKQGRSFPTPFRPDTSFPQLPGDIPIKDWNYGIVALGVGVVVTPNFGSSTISAHTADGARLDHAAGQASAIPVTGCIPGESAVRTQAVELDQYQYWFDPFGLTLGAYLNLHVAGYGDWNPRFDFLSLDLSGALGSAGLYLGDHVQCDFAFNCVAAPVDQRVKLTANVVDVDAPTTTLALAGTPGANGWFVSDVTGTLSAADNPVGCGSGVASTSWGLSEASLAAGTGFTLTSEGPATVSFGSTDRDGNREGTKSAGVRIDKTPPSIGGAPTTLPNERGWYRSDVVVHFTGSDAVSGLAALTPDVVVSDEAAGQSVVGEAVDVAGLRSTFTVSGINLDKTAPVIAITAPADGGYKVADQLTLAWTVDDPLSGILWQGATLDGRTRTLATQTEIVPGATIALAELSGGTHELAVTSIDNADNSRTATVAFLLDVDIDGLLEAIRFCWDQGWIKKGIAKSLIAKATQAKRMLAEEKKGPAHGMLNAFGNELKAQRDKGIKGEAYQLLLADVEYVMTRYGLSK